MIGDVGCDWRQRSVHECTCNNLTDIFVVSMSPSRRRVIGHCLGAHAERLARRMFGATSGSPRGRGEAPAASDAATTNPSADSSCDACAVARNGIRRCCERQTALSYRFKVFLVVAQRNS